MNLAYKHLDTKLRIAELTIGQWVGVIAGIVVAFVWGFSLSPFGTYPTLISAIYLGALPAGATLLASVSEFDPWLLLRAAIAWRRSEGRFTPGAGESVRGYALREDPEIKRAETARNEMTDLDLASLWEEQ